METIKVATVEDWRGVARNLAPKLKLGTILELSGPLGAGKTTFVQALAHALGSKVEPKSPTFALVRSYALSKGRLVHVDAYRIEKPEDVLTLGLDELLAEPGTIMAIEWPENIQAWLARQSAERRTLRIAVEADGTRSVEIS